MLTCRVFFHCGILFFHFLPVHWGFWMWTLRLALFFEKTRPTAKIQKMPTVKMAALVPRLWGVFYPMGMSGTMSPLDSVRILPLAVPLLVTRHFITLGLDNVKSPCCPPWGTFLLSHFHVTLSLHRMAIASLWWGPTPVSCLHTITQGNTWFPISSPRLCDSFSIPASAHVSCLSSETWRLTAA